MRGRQKTRLGIQHDSPLVDPYASLDEKMKALTLNPIKHLQPPYFLVLLLFYIRDREQPVETPSVVQRGSTHARCVECSRIVMCPAAAC
jgi:hypothetical protein